MKLLRLRISFVRVLGHVRKHEPTAFSMGKKQNKKNPKPKHAQGQHATQKDSTCGVFFLLFFNLWSTLFLSDTNAVSNSTEGG